MRTCCKVLWVIRLSTSAIERVVRRYEVSKTNENSERHRGHNEFGPFIGNFMRLEKVANRHLCEPILFRFGFDC
jgi:hypothetical protein